MTLKDLLAVANVDKVMVAVWKRRPYISTLISVRALKRTNGWFKLDPADGNVTVWQFRSTGENEAYVDCMLALSVNDLRRLHEKPIRIEHTELGTWEDVADGVYVLGAGEDLVLKNRSEDLPLEEYGTTWWAYRVPACHDKKHP